MIRLSQHILKYSNLGKDNRLDKLFEDYKSELQRYINLLRNKELPLEKYLSTKDLSSDIFKHSAWKATVYKQASEIVRSSLKLEKERKYKKYKKVYSYFKTRNRQKEFLSKRFYELNLIYKNKPNVTNVTIELNQILHNFNSDSTEFDEFVKIFLPYFKEGIRKAETINIPFKQHKQSLKFKDWNRKKTVQLKKINGNYYLNLIYEKETSTKKVNGKSIGIDIGYKNLLVTSEEQFLGKELEETYKKISRKEQGSKKFYKTLKERDNLINFYCNQLNLKEVKTLFIEDLKNVKYKSKFSKKFMNKLQRWSYPKVISKLERMTEEQGINLEKVSPAYTSQTCSYCGVVDRNSRRDSVFLCTACGTNLDADFNASRNVMRRGIYRLSTTEKYLNC